MRPLLVAALVASLALAGLAAWWPDAGADDLLPATRAPRATAAAALSTAPLRAPSAGPALAAATPASARTAAIATTAAALPSVALPTRAADWPAPPAAALAAWQGAAPVSLAAAAPALPAASAAAAAAPVFPYQWIGQLDDGAAPQALLASAQRSVAVRRGAVLDGRWRLDRAPGEPWKATHLPSGAVVAVRGAPAGVDP